MSEYQYVRFKAVDGPLNDNQFEFAQRQSSRAEVSRWSFAVDYHYSCFRGDVDVLLRSGYDVFLQYTDYGVREIKLRLPHGLPFTNDIWLKSVDDEKFHWKSDPEGRSGILTLLSVREASDQDELWRAEAYIDAAIQVREHLIKGDLRALYLLWLCVANDDDHDPAEMIEPPVPHGITGIAADCGELLSFFGLDPLVLTAAGKDVEPAPTDESTEQPIAGWIKKLSKPRSADLLLQLLTGDTRSVKASLLAEIRDSQTNGGWPTSNKQRSLEELLEGAETLRARENEKRSRQALAKAKQDAAKAQLQRADRMKQMLKSPEKWLLAAEQLVSQKGTENYQLAAQILVDLREAIGGDKGDKIARQHAARLVKKHPTLNILKSSLRKCELLES